MAEAAPLRVPVELRADSSDGGARWFRLARAVSVDGLALLHPLPPELREEPDRPLLATFHLPSAPVADEERGEQEPLRLAARAIAPRLDEEHAAGAPGEVRFVRLDEESRARIARYVEERLLPH